MPVEDISLVWGASKLKQSQSNVRCQASDIFPPLLPVYSQAISHLYTDAFPRVAKKTKTSAHEYVFV